MNIELLIFATTLLLFLCGAAAIRHWVKKSREMRSLARYNTLVAAGSDIPHTLHPVFDPTRCIGSGACTHACPQGDDVVGRIHGRGVLIDPAMCIGHGRCAAACPMGAIRLVFGTSERGVDIPHLSAEFETNVPGMFITGELGGMGLIANAVRQAQEGMANIARVLSAEGSAHQSSAMVDVAIIGAGPAGLTSALTAISCGLSYRLFEKESSIGGAILQYPRNKIIMTQPMQLPGLGLVRAATMSKVQLVSLFEKIITSNDIKLESNVRIEQIVRHDDGTFAVTTPNETIHARKVMLTIGRRGVPRKLGISGEHLSHVSYAMAEPDPFAGRQVLVVGGGDAAVETACILAELPGTTVSLSYRGEALSRVKPLNRDKFEALVRANRLRPIFNSNVTEITPEHAVIKLAEGEKQLSVDNVIIQIGGELPTALLQRFGISIARHYGEETEEHRNILNDDEVFKRIRSQQKAKGLQNFHVGQPSLPIWLKWSFRMMAVAVVGILFYTGKAYYLTDEAVRRDVESLQVFSASGTFGHSLGIWAAVLMGINLLYFARKEFRIFNDLGSIQSWMFFHQFSGTLAAIAVLLHTGLILYNAFALAMYVSLGIVVTTGIIGRYLFVMVPIDPRGRPLTHNALVDLSTRMKKRYTDLFGHLDAAIDISRILDLSYRPAHPVIVLFLRLFTIWPYRYFQLMQIFRRAQKQIPTADEFRAFKRFSVEMARLHLQLEIAPRIKRLLSLWRSGHALLAMTTVALVIIHIIIEIWVGY